MTPKPWRCDLDRPPERFPFADAEAETRQRQWESNYESVAGDYRVCRLIGQSGPEAMPAPVARIIELHDQWTRCDQDLPLA